MPAEWCSWLSTRH